MMRFALHEKRRLPHEIGSDDIADALSVLRGWPGYEPTPLHAVPTLGNVWLKEESRRFGVGNFKASGAAYALARLQREQRAGSRIVTASAGNYGLSLAWAARQLGLPCTVFVGDTVDARARDAIAAHGATLVPVAGTYDDAVRAAAAAAREEGWTLVSDTAFGGYEDVPRYVMAGYMLLLAELDAQLPQGPTHVIVQAGVGGLAGAVCAWYAQQDRPPPRIIVVEPLEADCLLQSSLHHQRTIIVGTFATRLVPLACGEPSTLAWRILAAHADAFVAISDRAAQEGVEAIRAGCSASIGPCAGAAAGALRALLRDQEKSAAIGLDRDARVLLIGTDGA
jgi:diaminopropionate ammonia-lyase